MRRVPPDGAALCGRLQLENAAHLFLPETFRFKVNYDIIIVFSLFIYIYIYFVSFLLSSSCVFPSSSSSSSKGLQGSVGVGLPPSAADGAATTRHHEPFQFFPSLFLSLLSSVSVSLFWVLFEPIFHRLFRTGLGRWQRNENDIPSVVFFTASGAL